MNTTKLVILFASSILILLYLNIPHGSLIYAQSLPQKETPETSDFSQKKIVMSEPQAAKDATFPYMIVQLFGEGGITYPGGKIAQTEADKPKVSRGYGGGVTLGYIFSERVGLTTTFEYQRQRYVINRTFNNYPLISTYDYEFINLLAGYYGCWKFLYGEVGLFFGYAAFDWKATTDYNGNKSTSKIKDNEKNYSLGLYYGVGCFYEINNDLKLKIGIRCENSFITAYKGNDEIKTNFYMIVAGIEKKYQ